MSSHTIESIRSKIIVDNHIYVFQKNVKRCNGLRYICVQRKERSCKGSITTDDTKTKIFKRQQHSHDSDSAKAEVCRALCAMKENIAKHRDKPSEVYAKEMTKLTDEAARLMPNENSVKRNLRRIRKKKFATTPTVSSGESVLSVSDKWTTTMTDGGGGGPSLRDNFVFYDNRSTTGRIIIFATPDCLRILSHSDHLLLDGTFPSCPKGFDRCCVLYAAYKTKPLPVAYALLPDGTRTIYTELLSALKPTCSSVKLFSIDFELATMTIAIEQVFGHGVSVRLCYDRLGRSVRRKIRNLGLATKYRENEEFRTSVLMMNALAFLPPNVVKKGMDLLYTNVPYDDDVDDILTYFDVTYVNGSYESIDNNTQVMCFKRTQAMFPPHMWNVHNATKLGYKMTNGISHGWNNKFQNLIKCRHPHMHTFIEALEMMNFITSMNILKLNVDVRINCKINRNEEKLTNICKISRFETNSEIIDFLKDVSNIIER